MKKKKVFRCFPNRDGTWTEEYEAPDGADDTIEGNDDGANLDISQSRWANTLKKTPFCQGEI